MAANGQKGDNKSIKFLDCIYTNPTSLGNKISELESLLVVKKMPHLVFVTETWFGSGSAAALSRYSLHKRDRVDKRGGGVAIYFRDDLSVVVVTDEKINDGGVEQLWRLVLVGDERILVGCIYRPREDEVSDRKS